MVWLRKLFVTAGGLTTALSMLLLSVSAVPAHAEPAAVVSRGDAGVTADGLPTAQIDGVAWTQVIIGDRVYVGGEFRKARPAGAAAGSDEVTRSNLLAYDLTTGELDPGFAPVVNGAVRTLAASKDGTRLLLGGDFTKVDGSKRPRFAEISLASGKPTSLRLNFDSTVRVVRATSSRIYVGGSFSKVGSTRRAKLAAFTTAGKLTGWKPAADNYVQAMTLTPKGDRLVVGGRFEKIGKTKVNGMASLDLSTGKPLSWKISSTIRDFGDKSAITSLTADSGTVYGSGYSYGGGNFEGAFAADPSTGRITWLQDCRGDTYSVAVTGSRLYSVGHAHNCQNIGGFGETKPISYRALAVGTAVAGTVGPNSNRAYNAFTGRPAPALVNWFPELTPGTYTGQSQAAWSVVADQRYVALAGEFTAVNQKPQQGLVRFALPSLAPNKQGPLSGGASSAPTVTADSSSSVSLSWRANHDRDDQVLSYAVLRNGVVVSEQEATSVFWDRPTLTATDTGLVPGYRYKYEIRATDPDGNSVLSASAHITMPTS